MLGLFMVSIFHQQREGRKEESWMSHLPQELAFVLKYKCSNLQNVVYVDDELGSQ